MEIFLEYNLDYRAESRWNTVSATAAAKSSLLCLQEAGEFFAGPDYYTFLEGFASYENWQSVPKENGEGYDVYLLGAYRPTLERHLSRNNLTHLGAVNLGLDLCAALAVCRRSGHLYVDLKPSNIFICDDHEYRIGDLGFIPLASLKYASLPDKYHSAYTAPEVTDAYSALNATLDIYAAGLIL